MTAVGETAGGTAGDPSIRRSAAPVFGTDRAGCGRRPVAAPADTLSTLTPSGVPLSVAKARTSEPTRERDAEPLHEFHRLERAARREAQDERHPREVLVRVVGEQRLRGARVEHCPRDEEAEAGRVLAEQALVLVELADVVGGRQAEPARTLLGPGRLWARPRARRRRGPRRHRARRPTRGGRPPSGCPHTCKGRAAHRALRGSRGSNRVARAWAGTARVSVVAAGRRRAHPFGEAAV